MPYFIKIIHVFLLAMVKYLFTPMYAHLIELDYVSTVFVTISGGVAGFLLFYYFTSILIKSAPFIDPYIRLIIPERIRIAIRNYHYKQKEKRKGKPKFTRRNKMLVRIINNYGLYTLVILTPTFLSIPLGAFLLRKYYVSHNYAVIITIFAIVFVGILETTCYWFLCGDL